MASFPEVEKGETSIFLKDIISNLLHVQETTAILIYLEKRKKKKIECDIFGYIL